MRKFLGCLLLPVAFFFLLFAAVTVFAFNSEAVAEGVDPFFAIAAAAVFALNDSFSYLLSSFLWNLLLCGFLVGWRRPVADLLQRES